ncbi:MAG: hypothetical protein N3E45_13520 [Oscillatoriaceae bacterium SKW80]|nr:hypothetical protein [Oscillatoriaceae bacterium SKYG93]MCX8121819.1 hypothetical protein [Oscillatoriaceae bacterium SKW80]MDW8454579.1 hypothetical protein [Oscillatoriaceae cyanobacterium SKYGB_i_bin93]HIK27393.1 hypothetical protein [Oscillatoriaceae cyanobacterium M7585_C2015_266]
MNRLLYQKILLISLFLLNCSWLFSPKSVLKAVAQTIPPARAATGTYTLIEVKGEVFLHKLGDANIKPASANSELNPGDLIIVTKRATATIRCADGRNWTLPEGISGVFNGCQVLRNNDPRVPNPRSPINCNSPFIISPRNTGILDSQTKIRWNPVSGTKRYTVKVWGTSGIMWETEVSAPEVIYTGKPLQAGEDYLVFVKDDSTYLTEGETAKFWMLDAQKAQEVREKITALTKENLSPEAFALAKANIYSSYSLFADAISTLEAALAKGNKTTAVYLMLGALYEQVGLKPLSETYYRAQSRT